MVASQCETYRVKRDVCRGRIWLRAARPRRYPAWTGRSPRDPATLATGAFRLH